MDGKRNDLFRWERLTQPRVYSRSQNVTTKHDIHDWMKSVEDASSTSTATTAYAGKVAGKKKVQAVLVDAQIHEEACAEAQDLLKKWMSNKVYTDSGLDDVSDLSDTWTSSADVKSRWDHLIAPDSDLVEDAAALKDVPNPEDIYRTLREDDSKLVNKMLGRIMTKPLFKPEFLADVGMDEKPTVDPRIKMELRHKMVKENREKRMQVEKKKLEEKRMKKEVQFEARKLVQQEDKVKSARKKQDEQEMQKHMAVIRKQMEDEKRLLEEQRNKERRVQESIAQKVAEELEKQREEERRQQRKTQLLADQRQRDIQIKTADIQAKLAANNLKSLQRHFSAWYGVNVHRRVQLQKARATSDWKCMLRVWNAWRAYVRDKHLDMETRKHEQDMRERHRKELQAKQHDRLHLLRKHFLAWQIFSQSQIVSKEVDHSKTRTKSKMAAFLQAATTGKLGQTEEEEDLDDVHGDSQVEELFLTDVHRPMYNGPPSSSFRSSQYTTRSEYLARNRKTHVQRSTEAWQIKKKHVKLTKKELEAMNQAHAQGHGQGQTEHTDQSESSKEKAWQKAPFVVDTYANRHRSQQKILEQQQKQITEQQRLIEELTYLQKQQMLQQQALQSQTQQLSAVSKIQNGRRDVHGGGDASKLQQHIDNLQRELVAKNQNLDELQQEMEKTQVLETERSDLTQTQSTRSKAATMSAKSTSSASQATTDSKHMFFLKSMEDRASKRAQIKKEREEKRRKEEDDKRLAMREQEERLIHQQEGEKRKRAEAFREKKRVEREREVEKQEFAERLKEMTKAADVHYERSVLKYRGWLPWLRLVEMAREINQRAESHHYVTLLRKCVVAWHTSVEEKLKEKKAVADNFYQYLLVRRYFGNWRKNGEAMTIQEDKAARHYKRRLQMRVITEWMDYASAEKVSMWHKERHAREHNTRRMQLTCLRAWHRFPSVLRDEVKREKRMQEMRQKVAALLPDYALKSESEKSTDFL